MKSKILILSLFLATLSLVGCKPTERIIEVPVEVTKYVQRSDTVQVYSTDSIYIRERNDTVWIEKYKTLYRDRIQVRVDTVPKVVKVTEKITIEKKIKVRGFVWWSGLVAIVALCVGIIIGLLRIKKKLLPLQ